MGPYLSWLFGAWPPDATPPVPSVLPTIDLYVSSTGNDLNPGTQALPLATLDAVDAKIPLYLAAKYRVHLRNQTYQLPARNYWLRGRSGLIGSNIDIFADEAWDPTVYTVQVAAASLAGTGAAVVVTAALGVNAQRGRTIRMTSGAAAGQYRRINSNTAANILLNHPFSPAPAPGDTFQIITPNTTINAPSAAVGTDFYLVADTFTTTQPWLVSNPGFADVPLTGVIFRGLRLTSTVSFCAIGGGPTYLLGVDLPANYVQKLGGEILSGRDDSALALLEGWGASWTTYDLTLSEHANFSGYVHSSGGMLTVSEGSYAEVQGGFALRSFLQMNGSCNINAAASTPFQFEAGASVIIQLAFPGSLLAMQNVTASGSGIIVSNGAILALFASVVSTGAVTMNVSGTGRVLCAGAPAYGGAGADWTVFGALPFNKAALAAPNSAVLGLDGSVATRSL